MSIFPTVRIKDCLDKPFVNIDILALHITLQDAPISRQSLNLADTPVNKTRFIFATAEHPTELYVLYIFMWLLEWSKHLVFLTSLTSDFVRTGVSLVSEGDSAAVWSRVYSNVCWRLVDGDDVAFDEVESFELLWSSDKFQLCTYLYSHFIYAYYSRLRPDTTLLYISHCYII